MSDAAGACGARVLIAGVSARAMAESAARAGFDVTTLDAFGDLDQHPSVRALSLPRDFGVAFSVRAVTNAAADIECDAVAYLSPFENHTSAVRRLAQRAPVWGNSASVLRRARDPRVLAAFQPNASRATRWLLKPRASGGGHGIRRWKPGDPVGSRSHVQPFFEGTAGSIVFVAARGAAVPLCLTRQLVGEHAFGASGFRYCGSILTPAGDPQLGRDAELADAAARLAADVARELELVGVNGIDFIACDGVPIPIEVNPRWSASMELVERAYALSVFGVHAAACTTAELPAFDLAHARAGGRALGKAVVFARRDVVCGDTHEWLGDVTVRDVPHPGERIAAGRPVCTVFADGADSAECHSALVQRADRVYGVLDAWSGVPA
jgi:uncharacterized protein